MATRAPLQGALRGVSARPLASAAVALAPCGGTQASPPSTAAAMPAAAGRPPSRPTRALRADLAARVVGPLDGALGDAEPLPPRLGEDLDVVDEPVLRGDGEQLPRDVGAEQLEPALRVAQRREHQEPAQGREREPD